MKSRRLNHALLAVTATCLAVGMAPCAYGTNTPFAALPPAVPEFQPPMETPAFWLRLAASQYAPVTASTTHPAPLAPTTRPSLSACDLLVSIAHAQQMIHDPHGIRVTVRLLTAQAQSVSDPQDRALAFTGLAEVLWDLGAQEAFGNAMSNARQSTGADPAADNLQHTLATEAMALLANHTGDIEPLVQLARGCTDPRRQARYYCMLAILAEEREDRADESRFLRHAADTAAGQDDQTASQILCMTAKAYAMLQRFDAARVTIGSIPLAGIRADACEALARRQWQLGDRRGYRDAIEKARDAIAALPPVERAWQYQLLAYLEWEQEDRAGARREIEAASQIIEEFRDPTERANGFFDLAETQGRMAEVAACEDAEAKALAAWASSPRPQIGQRDLRTGRYADIATALARSGKIDAALRMAKKIPPKEQGSTPGVYAAIAEAQAGAGRLSAARLSLLSVDGDHQRVLLCRQIGRAHASQREFVTLLDWLRTLATADERAAAALGAAEGLLGKHVSDHHEWDLLQ